LLQHTTMVHRQMQVVLATCFIGAGISWTGYCFYRLHRGLMEIEIDRAVREENDRLWDLTSSHLAKLKRGGCLIEHEDEKKFMLGDKWQPPSYSS